MLISDMEADMAAAAIDVHVGAALDPRPLHGVAHFLEHMLFQGTDKYPGENEYSEYIKNNGGYDNAFTSQTDTNYHFECSNEAFEGALDRLAQFFICPSFSTSAAEREVNAVDSEYNMALQHDGWHIQNLTQSISNPEGHYNKFHCGNKKTLANPKIRDQLLEFHKMWYSANIMNLCIAGKYSLETMEGWVTEKFGPVKNFDVVVPDLGVPAIFPPEYTSRLVKVVPVKDKDTINF
jgi:insulysin